MLNSKKPTEKVTEHVPSKSPLKTIAIVAGSLFALSHIGLLGYVLRPQEPAVQQPPTFNIPRGPYSSYKIKAGKDGYFKTVRSGRSSAPVRVGIPARFWMPPIRWI